MRPTFAEINLRAINTNLRNIRKKIGRRPLIMAVVKANAYGHGMIPVVSSILKQNTAQYFGVAIVEEGIELRTAFPHIPIHVFTAPLRQQLELFVRYALEPTLCDLQIAKQLNAIALRLGKKVSVHVKVDTGMGRIGISPEETVQFVRTISTMSNITIQGIYTHFATSDEWDLSFANKQLTVFRRVVTQLELDGFHVPLVHCANSGAIMQLSQSYFDMVRPGIMMYGYTPSRETRKTIPLQPALSLKGTVGFIKRVKKGTSISYGRRYTTNRETTIVSVTLGYADGYFRGLTNKASALIRGKRFPVVGTVCMDQVMIDVGNEQVQVGDEVVFIGSSGTKKITGWDIAEAVGTIPYEVTCAVSSRVPRKYINAK
ncbi:MAG: alanine racemase [Bacteroidota bacterium]